MNSFQPERSILNSEYLVQLFGYWPDFHDAEIIELSLWRGDLRPAENVYVFPKLMIKAHLWELTDNRGKDGILERRKHVLVTLQFNNAQDIVIRDFNYHNAITKLRFSAEGFEKSKTDSPETALVRVEIVQSHGIHADFNCCGIEVVSVVPCNENGVSSS